MKNNVFILVMGAALSVAAGQVTASDAVGEIKRVDGSAMISQGEHFVAAQAGMKLEELDRLMVLEQSEAMLEFKDGCRYVLKEGEMLTVGPTSACVDNPKTAGTTDFEGVGRTATSQLQGGAAAGGGVANMVAAGVMAGGALTGVIAGSISASDSNKDQQAEYRAFLEQQQNISPN